MGTYSSLLQQNIKSTEGEIRERESKPSTSTKPKKGKKERGVLPVREFVRKSERPEMRTEIRSEKILTKRLGRRYSFELYDDQITKLKQIKYQAEMAGQKLSLSDIARQALDEFLKNK